MELTIAIGLQNIDCGDLSTTILSLHHLTSPGFSAGSPGLRHFPQQIRTVLSIWVNPVSL